MSDYHDCCKCIWFWDYLIPLTRFWGIFTAVVLCGVGIDIYVHHHISGFYITLATLILFILETAWVVSLFLKVCINDEYSKIFTCWEYVLWVREWKKAVLYITFALILIFHPHHLWLSSVAGIMLILLGVLHFLHHWSDIARGYRNESLMDDQDGYINSCDINDDNAGISNGETGGNLLNNNDLYSAKIDIS